MSNAIKRILIQTATGEKYTEVVKATNAFIVDGTDEGEEGYIIVVQPDGSYKIQTPELKIIKVGNITEGDYLEILTDGTLRLRGESSAWDDFSVSLSLDKQGQTEKPEYDYTNLGLLFPNNDPTEIAYMIAQMKHAKKLGTDIKMHIHYIQTSAAQPTFKLDYRFYNNGEAPPATWTTVSTALSKGMIDYTSGSMLQIGTFPAISPPENETVSANIDMRLYRDDADVAGTVLAKYLDFHYQIDSFGSATEYAK